MLANATFDSYNGIESAGRAGSPSLRESHEIRGCVAWLGASWQSAGFRRSASRFSRLKVGEIRPHDPAQRPIVGRQFPAARPLVALAGVHHPDSPDDRASAAHDRQRACRDAARRSRRLVNPDKRAGDPFTLSDSPDPPSLGLEAEPGIKLVGQPRIPAMTQYAPALAGPLLTSSSQKRGRLRSRGSCGCPTLRPRSWLRFRAARP